MSLILKIISSLFFLLSRFFFVNFDSDSVCVCEWVLILVFVCALTLFQYVFVYFVCVFVYSDCVYVYCMTSLSLSLSQSNLLLLWFLYLLLLFHVQFHLLFNDRFGFRFSIFVVVVVKKLKIFLDVFRSFEIFSVFFSLKIIIIFISYHRIRYSHACTLYTYICVLKSIIIIIFLFTAAIVEFCMW